MREVVPEGGLNPRKYCIVLLLLCVCRSSMLAAGALCFMTHVHVVLPCLSSAPRWWW